MAPQRFRKGYGLVGASGWRRNLSETARVVQPVIDDKPYGAADEEVR
jgi:hypothetical protein